MSNWGSDLEDATRIRRSVLIAFERAELAIDAAERQRLLTFVIVGGGPPGSKWPAPFPRSRARAWGWALKFPH